MSSSQEVTQDTASIPEEAGWTSSSKYLGFQPREWEKFYRLQYRRHRKGSILAKSPFVPVNMKDWIEYRLKTIQADIEATKARIQACEDAQSLSVPSGPAFGGKSGMLRFAVLSHYHSRLNGDIFSSAKPQLEFLWTEADQVAAKELLGVDLMSKL